MPCRGAAPVCRSPRAVAPLVLAPVLVALLAGCSGGDSAKNASVGPQPTSTTALASVTTVASNTTTTRPATTTTAGKYVEIDEKQDLGGGATLTVHSASVTDVRRGQPPPPPGTAYAVVYATFCASPNAPLSGLDPSRFRVEVGGQGFVSRKGDEPPMGDNPMLPGASVEAGRCTLFTVSFLIAGEMHVETVAYDTASGPLRWAI